MKKRISKKSLSVVPRASATPRTAGERELGPLFDRIATILEEARARVVRSVNSEMVIAYWHIGRELVEHVQQGTRADYGDSIAKLLAARLTNTFGAGYSLTNLKYFRLFYQTYSTRTPTIGHTPSDQLAQH